MSRSKFDELRRWLYKLVWSVPFIRLAEQCGIPAKQLRELCEHLWINFPDTTYWQALRTGRHAEPEPLQPYPRWLRTRRLDEILALLLKRNATTRRQEVIPQPAIHILVEKTRVGLLAGIHDSGILWAQRGSYLDVRVTRRTLNRAIYLLDLLVRELESRGHEVAIVNDRQGWTQVLIGGVSLPLSLRERVFELNHIHRRWVRKDPAAREPEVRAAWDFEPLDVAGSGELSVHSYRVWTDRRGNRLEQRVGEVASDMEAEARRLRRFAHSSIPEAVSVESLARDCRMFAKAVGTDFATKSLSLPEKRRLAYQKGLATTFAAQLENGDTPPDDSPSPPRLTPPRFELDRPRDEVPGWLWNKLRRR